MMTADQPTSPKPRRRWFQYSPQIFVVLAGVLILSLVNWFFLAVYFVRASQGDVSFVPQINLLLILLVETTVLVFMLRLIDRLTGSGTTQRDLRWYQFSLGSLLVFMLLACVVMGFVMCWLHSQKAWGIAEANRSIKKYRSGDSFMIGSSIKLNLYEIEALGRMTELKDLYIHGPNVTDETLLILQRLNKLERLSLDESAITDMGLVHLSKLTNLQILHVRSTNINGIGFIYLKNLKQLQILDLTGTKITDAGLEHLKMLTQLKQLVLSETEITDAGLEHLKNMTSLECLYLRNTKVTDAGLEYLKGLNRLYWLDLMETKVTNAGIKDLQKALPLPLDIKLSESPSPDDN
jgi:hypothetical protein